MGHFRRRIGRFLSEGRLYIANYVIASLPSHTIRLAFYRRFMHVEIGVKSSIFMGAWFDTPGGLVIGAYSTVNQRCRLYSGGGLTIGNNVSISAEVCVLTGDHDIQSSDFHYVIGAVRIDDYVFVGTRALILPGVTIGKGAVVAANAVVTKNVEPYTIVAGIPARKIGTRTQDLAYNVNYRRLFQ